MSLERRINRRDLLKYAGVAAAGLAVPSIKEVEKEKKLFFHNGRIGLEMSEFLSGIIDLKYRDESTGKWELYNNIVPEVVAKGKMNNAEMFGLGTKIKQLSAKDGEQEIEIEYDRFDGIVKVGEYPFEGNGSHFSVVANIPEDSTEITFRVMQHEDSPPIESVSLGNFFGLKTHLRYLESDGQVMDILNEYDTPDDGNYITGDFYHYDPPMSGLVRFWSDNNPMIQYQKINTPGRLLRIEKRATPWRPEHSDPEHEFYPKHPWLELVSVFQEYSPEATWTFGFEINNNLTSLYHEKSQLHDRMS